ncbi:O-antigen translocase [Cedecea sp. MMO-103]|uniref:O-antigen translocase n=1 Tax=Cedecea sp. MMO-103 TaxID=3081238 RepID=UPI0030197512
MKKLFSVTAFTALLTLFKMLTGFFIAKVVAVYTGASGMAMLGQLQSFITTLNGVATAPVGNGIVKYTAENSLDGFDACARWWQASIQWALGMIFIVVIITFLLNKELSIFLFKTTEFSWLITLCCLVLPLSVINTAFISVINGCQRYKKYVFVGFISVIASTIIMIFMIYHMRLNGALIAAAINTAIAGIVVFIVSVREPWFKIHLWIGRSNRSSRKGIGGYVLMAVTSAVATPFALVCVRNLLIKYAGWDATGQWQAVWKISEVYLAVITMALTTYYLPQLAKLREHKEIKNEITQAIKLILPTVVFLSLTIYVLRDFIINLLFTPDFREARNLFAIQLIGDIVKIISWLYAFPMIAKGAVRIFTFTEIFFSFTFVLLSWLFISKLGVGGANWGYLVNYCLYFLFVYLNLNKLVGQTI